jgi:phospholipase C
VISPWSRGGWANSQVFDHTSVLQFLEQRFNVKEPNISPWRRAVCGDLTSAFNFINPNDEFLPPLQTTSRRAADKLRESQEQLPQVPVPAGDHKRPRQRQQARPSRALPYHIEVEAEPSSDSHQLTLTMRNTGQQGIVIHVYDKLHLNEIPRRYTIESGKLLSDVWSPKEGDNGAYDLWLLGPNGYHRALKGNLASRQPEVRLEHDGKSHTFLLTITNAGMEAVNLQIDRCPYTSTGPWHFQLGAGATHQQQFSTRTSGGWYDLTIRADQDSWERRLAGRLETGLASISDPLLGNA